MTRARGDEELSEEEEGEEALDLEEGSFRKLVVEWNGPDLVYSTVSNWISSDQYGKPTVGNFFQYCFTVSENLEEDYELKLWMLNLVAHYVAKEESWMEIADEAQGLGQPPPCWRLGGSSSSVGQE